MVEYRLKCDAGKLGYLDITGSDLRHVQKGRDSASDGVRRVMQSSGERRHTVALLPHDARLCIPHIDNP